MPTQLPTWLATYISNHFPIRVKTSYKEPQRALNVRNV